MAEIVSQGQGFLSSRRRWVELLAVVLVGAAITIAIAWAAFITSAPTLVTPTRTSVEYLQEPGLLDQRLGERGGDATVPGVTLSDPAMQEHRRGERGGDATAPGVTLSDPAMQEHRQGERATAQ